MHRNIGKYGKQIFIPQHFQYIKVEYNHQWIQIFSDWQPRCPTSKIQGYALCRKYNKKMRDWRDFGNIYSYREKSLKQKTFVAVLVFVKFIEEKMTKKYVKLMKVLDRDPKSHQTYSPREYTLNVGSIKFYLQIRKWKYNWC